MIKNEMQLTFIEDVLKSAKLSSDYKDSTTVRDLEASLQRIFRIARLNHNDFSAVKFREVPANQLGMKTKNALFEAQSVLDTLENLWKDSFEQYFDTTRYMFDKMNDKHLLVFRADIEISKTSGYYLLITRQYLPHFVKGDLYKVFYTARKNDTNCFHISQIADQSVRYLMIIPKGESSKEHFMKIKDLDACDIVNKTLLCDPRDGTFEEHSKASECLKALYKDNNVDSFCEFTKPNYNSSNCLNGH